MGLKKVHVVKMEKMEKQAEGEARGVRSGVLWKLC